MQRSTPPLHLVTDFEAPYQSALAGQPFGEVLQDSSPSNMDIPRIEIVDYAGASAASVPRDPSLQYATSDGSRPAFAALDWGLLPPNYSAMLSPPTSACSSPNYESVPYLSPPIPAEPASRRSSVSSLGLDYDGAPSIEIPGFIDEDGQTSQFETFPMFGDHLNTNDSPYNISPTSPTRFEMETLLDIFFDNAGVYGYRVDRGLFSAFLDVIGSPTPTGPYPVSMARFQVYMAIAIGMRVKMDGKTTDSQMLDNCYRLAMQQTESPHFWSQEGSVQAATLLVLFSRVSGV
ncbi:hypothetical protein MW887_000917 [Aspergillus wentii]|nr:hypothetical protein MW887_000917 [Aspergillus wentii]